MKFLFTYFEKVSPQRTFCDNLIFGNVRLGCWSRTCLNLADEGEWEIRVYFETFDGSDFDYGYKFPSVLTKSKNPIKGKYKRIITRKLRGEGTLEELIKEFDAKVILED